MMVVRGMVVVVSPLLQIWAWRFREISSLSHVTQLTWARCYMLCSSPMCSPTAGPRTHADSPHEGLYLFRGQNIPVGPPLGTWTTSPALRGPPGESSERDMYLPNSGRAQCLFPAAVSTCHGAQTGVVVLNFMKQTS